jgi:hypothetical protein
MIFSGATIDIEIHHEAFQVGPDNVLFYADAEDSWPRVLASDKSNCTARLQAAKLVVESGYFFQPKTLKVVGSRPRWWYIAVSNCYGNKITFTWNIGFFNKGGIFEKQFSKDEQGN